MTMAKGLRRRRRGAGIEEIPELLAKWFAGELDPMPDGEIQRYSEESLEMLRRMPEASLNRMERRALGLAVEPQCSPPWEALLPPWNALLPERWRAWKALHPGATPPRGWEWIDKHPSEIRGPGMDPSAARELLDRAADKGVRTRLRK